MANLSPRAREVFGAAGGNVDTSSFAKKTDIAAKADKTYVDTQLATKAATTALSAKADKTYVDTELGKKAAATDVAAKADKTYVDTQLATKAATTALNAKADTATMTTELAKKMDKTTKVVTNIAIAGGKMTVTFSDNTTTQLSMTA